MDFSDLVTREIDERFCYIKYDTFELIMMKENNYINATKLCKLGGKNLKHWLENKQSKDLIKELEDINSVWKPFPAGRNSGQLESIIIVESEGKNGKKYEVAGSYVHQDLLPHICSWISPSFAIKVSKIVNCYMSERYVFKIKEKEEEIKKRENKIDELMELLYKFNDKYDRDIAEAKERYREQRKEAKEHKKQSKELSNSVKRMEEKYDRDTRELKYNLTELKEYNKELKEQNKNLERKLERIEERLKDKVINPSSPNKLHRLVILQIWKRIRRDTRESKNTTNVWKRNTIETRENSKNTTRNYLIPLNVWKRNTIETRENSKNTTNVWKRNTIETLTNSKQS
ncbi:n1r/p28-like protein [Albatrosspox virus]|nr:n1r/p28-like protein [Albatrosspox virus]